MSPFPLPRAKIDHASFVMLPSRCQQRRETEDGRKRDEVRRESVRGGISRLVNQSENSDVGRRQATAVSKRRIRHVKISRKHPN